MACSEHVDRDTVSSMTPVDELGHGGSSRGSTPRRPAVTHRCSLHCLLPPHVLESIATNGDDDQRLWAVQTMSIDHTLRSARLANAVTVVAPPAYANVLAQAGTGTKRRTIYDCQS